MANALNIDQQSDRALKKYDPFKLDFSTSFSFSNETESIWLLIKKRIRWTFHLRIRFFFFIFQFHMDKNQHPSTILEKQKTRCIASGFHLVGVEGFEPSE